MDAHLEDDEARLAFARALARTDSERSEFIELQVELAARPTAEVRQRQQELLDRLGAQRLAPLPKGMQPSLIRRGFVEAVFCDAEDFRRGADELFSTTPVSAVNCWSVNWTVERAQGVRSGLHPRVQRLSLSRGDGPHLKPPVLEALLAGPELALVELDLAGMGIDGRCAPCLGQLPASLERLCLARNPLGPRAGAALGKARLERLRELNLFGCELHDAGLVKLCRADWMDNLEELTLSGDDGSLSHRTALNGIGAAGIKALAGRSSALRILRLDHNRLGDAGAAILARGFGALTYLGLGGNAIGDVGAQALAASTSPLRELRLEQNALTYVGGDALVEGLPTLEVLGLSFNAFPCDRTVDWVDWDGSIVGSGPDRVSLEELRQRYGSRPRIE